MDDTKLAFEAQQGNLEAFNHLVLSYQEIAYNIAYRLLSDPYAAEDATQTAFISAYKNIRSYRGGSFRSWLFRIVTNACYDQLRHKKRHPTVPLEPVDSNNDEIESADWLADDSQSPEDRIGLKELDQAIQQCLNDLPDEFRSVVVLVDVHEMDYQETADILHKPIGTIKSRLARARVRMRDCLLQLRELLPAKFRLDHDEGKP